MTTQENEEVLVEEEIPETKTIEEIKAEAEALESEIKALKQSKEDDELRFNQTRRLEKAQEKLAELRKPREEAKTSKDIDFRDLITLSKVNISEGSEEAQILEKYKNAGLIKDFASGLESVGIKAEFEAIKAKNNAASIIDENDKDGYLRSKKEIIAQYRTSGEVPADPKLRKDIALDNLKEMGL